MFKTVDKTPTLESPLGTYTNDQTTNNSKLSKKDRTNALISRAQPYLPLLKGLSDIEVSLFTNIKIEKQLSEALNSQSEKDEQGEQGTSDLSKLCKRNLLGNNEQAYFRYLNYLRFKINELYEDFKVNSCISNKKLTQLEEYINKADQIRNDILLSNQRLIASLMKNRISPRYSIDEAMSDMQDVAIKCIMRFDYSRAGKFSSYLSTAILRAAKTTFFKQHREHIFFSQLTNGDSIIANIQSRTESETRVAPSLTLLNLLPPEKKQVIEMRLGIGSYSKPHEFQEIGDTRNCRKQAAEKFYKRAIVLLAKIFENAKNRREIKT